MRKNVIGLLTLGILFLSLGILSVIYSEEILLVGLLTYVVLIVFFFVSSVLFLSVAANIIGKGDCLSLGDLISGKEYILIQHVSVKKGIVFSLVGEPDSENFVSIKSEDLSKLNSQESFVIIEKKVRKII